MNTSVTKQQQEQPVRRENGHYQTWSPPVDIYETKEAYVLRADMPGIAKDGLDLTVEGTTLTMTGKRTFTRQGQAPRSIEYRRVFELDPTIDFGKVKAHIDHGVVTVELPKAEKVKPRKI